jgi:hypothetical protein
MALVNLLGKKFGRLTVVRMTAERSNKGSVRWLCVCRCGNHSVVVGDSLRCGETRSCGCLRIELLVARTRTHGFSSHPLYRTWDHMKSRCFNPNNKEYHNYGARGISVCPQWQKSFPSFCRYILRYLGPRPRGKSLDRYPDNDGPYAPGNVRWATARQQTINQRQRRSLRRGVYVVPSGYRAAMPVGRTQVSLRLRANADPRPQAHSERRSTMAHFLRVQRSELSWAKDRPIKSEPTADVAMVSSTNGSGEITAESPLCDRLAEIERRVSTALTCDMTSSALAKLCQQLGFAVIAADESAAAEHDRSLDPTASPDPHEARQVAEDAAFMADRLKTMQPRLAAHFQKVYAAEKVQTHLAKLRELAPLHNALQQELRTTFQEATAKLMDLFQRVRDHEQRVRQQLGDPPPGVDVLPALDGARVLDKTVLPDWSNPDRNAWPPRPVDFAASFAASMVPQHPGPMWSDPVFQERRRAPCRRRTPGPQRMGAGADSFARRCVAALRHAEW